VLLIGKKFNMPAAKTAAKSATSTAPNPALSRHPASLPSPPAAIAVTTLLINYLVILDSLL
jgi:hypothetical protein